MARQLTAAEYIAGVLAGERATLARAITLIESRKPQHAAQAQEVLGALLPHTGKAWRVGITGVPGVGKSTFIEALGLRLVEEGKQVAVLAVDPSSSLSGGSILGDKSRMERLAVSGAAFIRPSPSDTSLGGVARRTRESLLLCEAAGYDVILVETVGVGQSETVVAEMVDTFVVLMLAGAGDELQGIKKGILELADVLAVNKADGDNLVAAQSALGEYASALRYTRQRTNCWRTAVLAVSALTGAGLAELWQAVSDHRAALIANGQLDIRRREQRRQWMWSLIEERLLDRFRNDSNVCARLSDTEAAVMDGQLSATAAAWGLLEASRTDPDEKG